MQRDVIEISAIDRHSLGRASMTRLSILLAACASIDCLAQLSVVPAVPKAQETVRVRIAEGVIGQTPFRNSFDTYNPRATRVSMAGNKITVSLELADSQLPERPPSRELDLPLGQFPPGSYEVEVSRRLPDGTSAGTIGTATFAVSSPSGNDPLWNHTDLWWNPQESGWGLNVVQHGSGILFATWFVYGSDGKPTWYVVSDGQWVSPGEYRGSIYRTSGPQFEGPFNPALVTRTLVGSAVFGFDTYSANALTLFSTIDGKTTVKQLQRTPF